ncbi:MAG: amidase [Myxococcales bacterium]|nr:amidase [Myxococcota bacterium]MDW8281750.1 amidase [Myxococcales bacterium]
MKRSPPSLAARLLGRRLSGRALSTVLSLLRTPALARAVSRLMATQLGLEDLGRLGEAARRDPPLDVRPLAARPPRTGDDQHLGPLPVPQDWPIGCAALQAAYAAGATDPVAVLARLLRAAQGLGPRSPLCAAAPGAEEAALASAERHRRGAARSPLDGIPVTIKEEIAIAGLPLRLGARFTSEAKATRDGTLVARLRAAGAVVAAQTKMTEYGLSPLGASAQQSLPTNPHAPGRAAGGSSTGAAVAVALGLGPLSIGGDGGGSIRIPAALCGVFGLKPTFGRVPRTGDPLGGTLDHLGPLGASVQDLAACLDVIGGPDPEDPATAWAPPQPVSAMPAVGRGVRGLRIGVCDELWSECDADIAHECTRALDRLCAEGASRVALSLPLARHAVAIGALTFGGELLSRLRPLMSDERLGPDLRITLRLLAQLPLDAYVDAQRLRAALREELRDAFGQVDLVALPTTATCATELSEVEAGGLVDVAALEQVVRFTFLANLTGLPALSAPVGERIVPGGVLPIGLQLLGDAWDEATVLAAGAHLERIGAARVRKPPRAVSLLAGQGPEGPPPGNG